MKKKRVSRERGATAIKANALTTEWFSKIKQRLDALDQFVVEQRQIREAVYALVVAEEVRKTTHANLAVAEAKVTAANAEVSRVVRGIVGKSTTGASAGLWTDPSGITMRVSWRHCIPGETTTGNS